MAGARLTNCSDKKSACGRFFLWLMVTILETLTAALPGGWRLTRPGGAVQAFTPQATGVFNLRVH